MKWTRGYDSRHLDDRRGRSPGLGAGGLGMLVPLLGRFGLRGGLVIFALLALVYFGRGLLGGGGGGEQAAGVDDTRSFVGFVLDDAQATWTRLFEADGRTYDPARVVLYSGAARTACGFGTAQVGPFYCPRDRKVYLDASFFRQLEGLGAPGDFAQAYVIAHEIGHHVQRQRGLLEEGSSVETELQADCLAGVWARAAGGRDLLEPGDLDEAMRAAAAAGDDRLQRAAGQAVRPESFTHGSSAQRKSAFGRGYASGKPSACGL